MNLVLSWNTLVFPSTVIESFAGYRSLGWHLCSLRVCMTSDQALLAFIVSVEKSCIICGELGYAQTGWSPVKLRSEPQKW